MLLSKFCYISQIKLFGYTGGNVLCKRSLNKFLISKKFNGPNVIKVKCQSTFPPPPGVTPTTPKAIPYVNHSFRQRKGGGLLLIIPIFTFGLGTWQIFRLKWKTSLIDTINKRLGMDPVPLSTLDPDEVGQMEFQRVIVKGTFDHENEIYYGPKPCLIDGEPNSEVISRTGEGSYGFNLVTPFVLSDSGERILVNRGWIRTKTVPQEKRPWSITEGEQIVTGIVRTAESKSSFVPTVVPRFNVWHYRDIEGMSKEKNCLPIYIDATVDHSLPNLLWGGQTRTALRNEHLSYILTWYSLSIATSYLWYVKFLKK